MKSLPKTFDPQSFEQQQYHRTQNLIEQWQEDNKYQDKPKYTIMMPPPNVTGRLHIGHALTFTLQDILVRYKRMQGYDVLWQPGTDHAGIATQMVVERQLAAQGINRADLGREKFLERVWQWKEESGNTILEQLKRLGASASWNRTRFTMDQGLSQWVSQAFRELYDAKLIYKAERLVNWDTKLQTAISDLEVIQKEVVGAYYHIKYEIIDDANTSSIIVATTRPETLFGDLAIAIHPNDDRYQHLVGKQAKLPLTDRTIPIIADEYSDPNKGSGAVKITPSHDFNDFAVGKRHNLGQFNILNQDGTLNENTPFAGLTTKQARKQTLFQLKEQGLLVKEEQIKHMVPYGDRSDTIIEPYLTWQWFCDAPTLAKQAYAAVKNGDTRFIPAQWQNTYFHWLDADNIQPWCISRQLWWGHRIPAWYDQQGNIYVASSLAEAQGQAGKGVELVQDEDVLDTWFSSALWPFSTLVDEEEIASRYPTSLLITGFDIIFFWVARMMMMGLYFQKQVPFQDVYIHALVRDAKGQKMSKSKGNVVDPLTLIDEYGCDAVRFTLAIMAVQGRDVNLDTKRVAGYRNFATKIWNAVRFATINGANIAKPTIDDQAQHPVNKWIVHQLEQALTKVSSALENYKFNEASEKLYHFIWGDICDWYIECAKVMFDDEQYGEETKQVCAYILQQAVKMLHPFMPFITEEISQQLGWLDDDQSLTCVEFPIINANNPAEIGFLQNTVKQIRSLRKILNIQDAKTLDYYVENSNGVDLFLPLLSQLARVNLITTASEAASLDIIYQKTTIKLLLPADFNSSGEVSRLEKNIHNLEKAIAGINNKLNNPKFIANAKAKLVEEEKQKLGKYNSDLTTLENVIRALL
jgi:valyl-tRNA synthetase